MKQAKYERRGKVIINLETKEQQQFKHINEAKRESHKLQIALDGGLGRGSVRRGW